MNALSLMCAGSAEMRALSVSEPFGREFSMHRYDHQAIPQHGCVPAEPASVSPGQIIVAPPQSIHRNPGSPSVARDTKVNLRLAAARRLQKVADAQGCEVERRVRAIE